MRKENTMEQHDSTEAGSCAGRASRWGAGIGRHPQHGRGWTAGIGPGAIPLVPRPWVR
jgi:hypothetical protein